MIILNLFYCIIIITVWNNTNNKDIQIYVYMKIINNQLVNLDSKLGTEKSKVGKKNHRFNNKKIRSSYQHVRKSTLVKFDVKF